MIKVALSLPRDAMGKLIRRVAVSDLESLSSVAFAGKSNKGKGQGKAKSSKPNQEINFDKKVEDYLSSSAFLEKIAAVVRCPF